MYERLILPRYNYDNILVIAYSDEDVQFIRSNTVGLPKNVTVVDEATVEEVEGKFLIGRIPFSLAAKAAGCISIEIDSYGEMYLQRFNVIGWDR